ncbi:MAG: hypothetical protein HDR00_13070 [Lachnospiraceae bacterium]|nr:hypothetical protein [Lachnospiraceae bacterium]
MERIYHLCRIELYRFFHSISIIKYMIFIPAILFLMSYMNIAYSGDEITDLLVWASLSPVFLYLVAFICTIVAFYVGREFIQKTIYYEIMSGYGFFEIAFAKIVTCGILAAALILASMILYLGILLHVWSTDFFLRVLFLFALFFHLCSGAVLYVLLCKNPVSGGCLAFTRFFLAEAVMEAAVGNLPFYKVEIIRRLLFFYQWYELINVEKPLTVEWMISIIAMAAVEYGILQGVLLWRFKKADM